MWIRTNTNSSGAVTSEWLRPFCLFKLLSIYKQLLVPGKIYLFILENTNYTNNTSSIYAFASSTPEDEDVFNDTYLKITYKYNPDKDFVE